MRSTPTALLALAAVTVCVLPAAADAKPLPLKFAYFDVSLSGRQTVDWESHHLPDSDCDAASDGRGHETYTFHTRRKLHVRVMRTKGKDALFLMGLTAKEPAVPLTGTVDRSGEIVT